MLNPVPIAVIPVYGDDAETVDHYVIASESPVNRNQWVSAKIRKLTDTEHYAGRYFDSAYAAVASAVVRAADEYGVE